MEHRPAPKIGPLFTLIALILFGVAVIAVAAVVLLRSMQATAPREARYPDQERGEREAYEKLYGERSGPVAARYPDQEPVEREVYEKLYGKRSGTVSAPLPVEPPRKANAEPKADADSSHARTPSADPRPRTRRRSRARDSHR